MPDDHHSPSVIRTEHESMNNPMIVDAPFAGPAADDPDNPDIPVPTIATTIAAMAHRRMSPPPRIF
jgi:hypothetical protein